MMILRIVDALLLFLPSPAGIATIPSSIIRCQGLQKVSGLWQITVSLSELGDLRWLNVFADIHIWAPQQAQAFSVESGRNALLELILPLAFENSMLFESTIAMTRAAWVLRRETDPFGDKMLLRHRGMAMKELRDTLVAPEHQSSDLVLLTMSTLLTLNVRADLPRL
jgi:hypothetical protein